MLKQTGRLLVLLVVIGIVVVAMFAIVNTSESSSASSSGNEFSEFIPDQQNGINQPPPRPEFEGERDAQGGNGAFAAIELLKNFGIMACITGIGLIVRKIFAKLKPHRTVATESKN